jgi:coproporphyrinogen III oxidase-like Fe-S oxidoreductase
MGLRISEGIALSRYAELAGHPPDAGRLARLEKNALISRQEDRIAVTPAGRRVLNAVVAELAV